jgi:hypothetical protein
MTKVRPMKRGDIQKGKPFKTRQPLALINS